jgi:hypothetical protein
MINLSLVKAGGARLALEAELTQRNQMLQDNLKEARTDYKKFTACVSYAKDIVQLLEEIVKETNNVKEPIPNP